MTNTYLRDRKLSDIGVMMAIDALIENGFVIIEPDKNEKLIGTEWEINLDRDYHVDISAYEVNDENKERWRNRRPRPTAIDRNDIGPWPAINEPVIDGHFFGKPSGLFCSFSPG